MILCGEIVTTKNKAIMSTEFASNMGVFDYFNPVYSNPTYCNNTEYTSSYNQLGVPSYYEDRSLYDNDELNGYYEYTPNENEYQIVDNEIASIDTTRAQLDDALEKGELEEENDDETVAASHYMCNEVPIKILDAIRRHIGDVYNKLGKREFEAYHVMFPNFEDLVIYAATDATIRQTHINKCINQRQFERVKEETVNFISELFLSNNIPNENGDVVSRFRCGECTTVSSFLQSAFMLYL